MKQRTGVFLLLIVLTFGASNEVFPNSYLDSTKVQALTEGQMLLFNDRFSTVDSLYDSYIAEYPNDPAGYLFRAAALMGMMADREEKIQVEKFKALLDSVESITDKAIDSCDEQTRAWLYLMKGHAKAYRSLWESRFGSFLSAVKLGFSARSEYSNGLRADSTCYDLYLGLGTYHYWKSAKGGLLRFLRILKNEKDKGIEELYLAADSSLLSRDAARSALIWVYLDRKQYDSVVTIAGEFVSRFPYGKSFLWPLATAHHSRKQYQEALATYQKIRKHTEVESGNYFNLIECDYYICRCLEKLDRQREAIREARQVSRYYNSIPGNTRERQRTKLVYLLRLAGK